MSSRQGAFISWKKLVGIVAVAVALAGTGASRAADVVTATKSSTSTTPASFSIATNQIVGWEAKYSGSGTEGNDFYLHHSGSLPVNEIPLSTNLSSGFNLAQPLSPTSGLKRIMVPVRRKGPHPQRAGLPRTGNRH